jgi:hypothetical protein
VIVPSRVISGWIHILPSNISARRIVGSAIGIIIAWGTAIVVLAFWAQTARFMLLFELTAMVTMGRLALNGLDRAIHRFRTVQTA